MSCINFSTNVLNAYICSQLKIENWTYLIFNISIIKANYLFFLYYNFLNRMGSISLLTEFGLRSMIGGSTLRMLLLVHAIILEYHRTIALHLQLRKPREAISIWVLIFFCLRLPPVVRVALEVEVGAKIKFFSVLASVETYQK